MKDIHAPINNCKQNQTEYKEKPINWVEYYDRWNDRWRQRLYCSCDHDEWVMIGNKLMASECIGHVLGKNT